MINLELSTADANILHEQLAYRITELDRDLVRTDKRQLQHALAEDVKRLGEIAQRLEALLRGTGCG